MTTLADSKLIKGLDYTTIQRVIGEDCKFLDLVYKATRDGFGFQDLTRRLKATKQHTEEYKDKRITWVYLIKSNDRTFGFRTVMKNDVVVECYMFSLNIFRRFYAYLDKITVASYYPSGIDLFDSDRLGYIDNRLEFNSNGISFYNIFEDMVTEYNRFDINQIELYVTTLTMLEHSVYSVGYELNNETGVRFRGVSSEILETDNVNMFERLITPLDNVMFYARLINTDSVELPEDKDIDFEYLTYDNNVLVLFKSLYKVFALYIPRNNYECIEDYNKFNKPTLYSLSLDEVIQLDEYELKINKSWKGTSIKLIKEYGNEVLRLIKLRDDGIKPMYCTSYNLWSSFSPAVGLSVNDIFNDDIEIEYDEDYDETEYIHFELDYIKVEVYLVGRDELMHDAQSKRDVRDIISFD